MHLVHEKYFESPVVKKREGGIDLPPIMRRRGGEGENGGLSGAGRRTMSCSLLWYSACGAIFKGMILL
jgi:hypothetical protein